jgi:hypothetical protein
MVIAASNSRIVKPRLHRAASLDTDAAYWLTPTPGPQVNRLLPVSHIGIFTLAARGAVLSVGVNIQFGVFARILVVVFILPRIKRDI